MQRLYASADGEPPGVPPWFRQPEDEYPVLLPVGEFLARTEGTVIALSRIEVYSTGVVIDAEVVLRRRGESDRDWSWLLHGGFGRRDRTGDGLRWTVALPDGSTAEAGDVFTAHRTWDERPEGWTLTFANGSGGGGGAEDHYEQRHGLWLWPLPPAGPLEFSVEWREREVADSRIVLDGAAIHEAVPRVRPLWP